MSKQRAVDRPSSIWKTASSATIVQAALLMLDIEPQNMSNVEQLPPEDQPEGYLAARNAIETAIIGGSLAGELQHIDFSGVYNAPEDPWGHIDYHTSKVMMPEFKHWLIENDRQCYLTIDAAEIRNGWAKRDHPRFARKLAAATEAWERYEEYADRPGSTKQKIENWLRENADRLDLLNRQGGPADSVIQELAEFINWVDGPGRRKR